MDFTTIFAIKLVIPTAHVVHGRSRLNFVLRSQQHGGGMAQALCARTHLDCLEGPLGYASPRRAFTRRCWLLSAII